MATFAATFRFVSKGRPLKTEEDTKMEHTQIRNLLGQHISSLIAQPGNLPLTLHPFQIETLESAARWLSDPQGTKRAYVSHATGLGKTIIFASMVAATAGMRSLVIVPTKTLLEQTARVIAKFTGGMLGHLSSLANIQDHDGETVAVRGLDHSAVLLTTDASFNKLAAKIKQEFDPHLIIRDECHWGYIGPALAALEQFPEAAVIGFSATPDYLTNTPKGGYVPVKLENGQTLYGPIDRFADTHFQTCLDRRSVRWGIENGWLCPLAWGMIEFDVSLKNISVVDGPNGPDYDEAKLQELMGKHWSIMCETVRRLYDNPDYDLSRRQAYAICPSVEAAEELAQTIGSLGVSAACVTGNTPDTERNILLRAFNDNEIRFLSSVMVLREGWDAPDAEVCMMLRPTKSRVLYEQGIGRALRLPKKNGYKVALILDAFFQASTFSPLSAPALFGKPGEEIPSGGMLIGNNGCVRGGEKMESPYLPKGAQPKLVVIEVFDQIAHTVNRAESDGTFKADKERWATRQAVSRILNLNRTTLNKRLSKGGNKIRTRQALDPIGHERTFYSVKDITAFLGVRMMDENRATASPEDELLSPPMLAERLMLGVDAVEKRLNLKSVMPVTIKNARNQDVKCYSLVQAKEACRDLLDRPLIGEGGTLQEDNILWISRGALMLRTSLSRSQVMLLLASPADVRRLKVRAFNGKKINAFAFPDIEKYALVSYGISPTLLPYSPQIVAGTRRAGIDGTFIEDGKTWIGAAKYAALHGTDAATVKRRAKSHGLEAREGFTRLMVKRSFYSVDDLDRACADLLAKRAKAKDEVTSPEAHA